MTDKAICPLRLRMTEDMTVRGFAPKARQKARRMGSSVSQAGPDPAQCHLGIGRLGVFGQELPSSLQRLFEG